MRPAPLLFSHPVAGQALVQSSTRFSVPKAVDYEEEMMQGRFDALVRDFSFAWQHPAQRGDVEGIAFEKRLLKALPLFNTLLNEKLADSSAPIVQIAQQYPVLMHVAHFSNNAASLYSKNNKGTVFLSIKRISLTERFNCYFLNGKITDASQLLFTEICPDDYKEKLRILFPHLKISFKILVQSFCFNINSVFFNLIDSYQKENGAFSLEEKHEILFEALRAYSLKPDGNSAFKVEYICRKILNPKEVTLGKWYQHFNWITLNQSTLFLIGYIDSSSNRDEVIAYIQNKYPRLTYHLLLRGNFSLCSLLLKRGWTVQVENSEKFLTEALALGLEKGTDLKKHHAFLLMQYSMQLASKEEVESTQLFDKLFDSHKLTQNVKQLIESRIPLMVQAYIQNMGRPNDFSMDKGVSLNRFMLRIEELYATAISAIYASAVYRLKTNVYFSRGITLTSLPLNEELLETWFKYGHRCSNGNCQFLGYAPNMGIYNELEEPLSDEEVREGITFIATSSQFASDYMHADEEDENGYLLILSYPQGEPIWVMSGTIRHEAHMPFIKPEAIAAIHRMSREQAVVKTWGNQQVPQRCMQHDGILKPSIIGIEGYSYDHSLWEYGDEPSFTPIFNNFAIACRACHLPILQMTAQIKPSSNLRAKL